MKGAVRTLLIGLVVTMCAGCFLAPAIDSFNQLGVTKGDRMVLLPMNVKRYHDALYWGRPDEALLFVVDTSRPMIADSLKMSRKSERIMESSVESVDFSEDAFTADVEVQVRYLNTKIATNVIQERIEAQSWEFSVTDGWKLKSIALKHTA